MPRGFDDTAQKQMELFEVSKKKAVYFTRFDYLPTAGGGCRRFVQIVDDLREYYSVAIVSTRDREIYDEAVRSNLQSVSCIGWDDSYHAAQRYLLMGEFWAKHHDLSQYDVIIMDDPAYFPSLVYKAESMGLPVVGVCHNLETIAQGQVANDCVIQSLRVELGIFQHVNCAITISQEENFLLRNLGLNTLFHPYYPCQLIEQRMHNIRTVRQRQQQKKQILFFGSLGNIPTRIGLERLLDVWSSEQLMQKTGYELVVTGFGSEKFKNRENIAQGIKVLGPLSDPDFDEKLAEVESIIIYQDQGSGALTRINETLLAGVSILANEHAARSYRNLNGVVEFADDFSDMQEAIVALDHRIPSQEISAVPKPSASKLHSQIERRIGQNPTNDVLPMLRPDTLRKVA